MHFRQFIPYLNSISLNSLYIEETAYRYAGKFNDDELKGMTEMFKCGRGEGVFDQAWVSHINNDLFTTFIVAYRLKRIPRFRIQQL